MNSGGGGNGGDFPSGLGSANKPAHVVAKAMARLPTTQIARKEFIGVV